MYKNKPIGLILYSCLTISGLFVFSFIIINYTLESIIHWHILIPTALIIFITSFLSFTYIIKAYIYDKIKVIYKTISSTKYPKAEKNFRININQDIINDVGSDVEKWANSRNDEIENLKRLENFRREFIGNISHELKTPIFNIQGYVLTLIDGALDDKEVNMLYLQKTERNIERLISIVEDLGIISQLESGEIELNYETFDIINLINEVFEHLENKSSIKNISLLINPQSITVYSNVNADKERIRQVLVNLIENSIKYGIEGGKTKVSIYDMDEKLLIEVSDNGIGIESSHLSRLFERFYRVDRSRSRDQGGSGLGLAIVKHIIESHYQTINVRSTPNIGSSFSFTLSKA